MDHANRGAKALAEGDPMTALVEYTKALIEHPTSPDYFTQRSLAFSRIEAARHDLALKDAEYGVLCGQKRGKRDKIQAAQQRRVIALYNLGRYADAKLVLDSMKRWRPSNSKPQTMEHDMWSAKINTKLKNKPQDPTTTEYPSTPLPDDKDLKKILQKELMVFDVDSDDVEEKDEEVKGVPASATTATPAPQNTPAPTSTPATTTPAPQKIRHEWYQNNQSVIITLYAKGVQKDKTEVDIEEDSLSISFPHPSDLSSSFSFTLDPLSALIDPSKSKHQVMSTKVEITLAKVEQGKKWANLEGTAPLQKSNGMSQDQDPAKAAVMSTLQPSSATATAAPSYPTSSRKGPKNWDKLASDLTAKKPKKAKKKSGDGDNDKAGSDSDGDGEDDGYESEMGGDAVDGFFKKLYKDADPDTQRAMMKSFTESNGTALSTNWSEVGKKKVDEVKSKDDD